MLVSCDVLCGDEHSYRGAARRCLTDSSSATAGGNATHHAGRHPAVRWSALLGTGEWPAMVEVASQSVLRLTVKLEAMHEVGAGERGGHQACLPQKIGE